MSKEAEEKVCRGEGELRRKWESEQVRGGKKDFGLRI